MKKVVGFLLTFFLFAFCQQNTTPQFTIEQFCKKEMNPEMWASFDDLQRFTTWEEGASEPGLIAKSYSILPRQPLLTSTTVSVVVVYNIVGQVETCPEAGWYFKKVSRIDTVHYELKKVKDNWLITKPNYRSVISLAAYKKESYLTDCKTVISGEGCKKTCINENKKLIIE